MDTLRDPREEAAGAPGKQFALVGRSVGVAVVASASQSREVPARLRTANLRDQRTYAARTTGAENGLAQVGNSVGVAVGARSRPYVTDVVDAVVVTIVTGR